MPDYLHNHKDFSALLNIVAEEKGIQAGLVEKDYWIMHVLYGLKSQGFSFELKGGTSLSKGYKVIHRFSEDIDIHIKPPDEFGINENPKNNNKNNVAKRKEFYDWLAGEIKISGITSVVRDTAFDDETFYRSGGIRLIYDNTVDQVDAMKEGILLEAGFDDVTPNAKITISSWAYDKAIDSSVDIIDNRGVDIVCYHPGYTFVEKLQTIVTKFRQEQNGGARSVNFMRQYYDVYCLLEHPEVLGFIGTAEYTTHKQKRFPKADLEIPISKNEAFLLSSSALRADFTKRYKVTAALYYQGQPEFEALLKRIAEHCHKL
ncbi:MAG: nucleotidyl transferase AbiEii/AbiGii toxin family protein [Bacteroidia bacterium]